MTPEHKALIEIIRQGMTAVPLAELMRMSTEEWRYYWTAKAIIDAGWRPPKEENSK